MAVVEKKYVILIVAGGTGGHLYPGIAVAQALKEAPENRAPSLRIVFVVRSGDIGREILDREGFEVRDLAGQGFPRELSLKALNFPLKFIKGLLGAFALLHELKPDFVLGMGGYLSFPVLMAARLKGIATMIHEQNVFPGVANRFLSRFVESVAVSFPESRSRFPAGKSWLSGLPIRSVFKPLAKAEGRRRLGLDPELHTIFVFGGSLGARRLNKVVLEMWEQWDREKAPLQVIHVTGTQDEVGARAVYNRLQIKGVITGYCHEMALAYGAADLVICRAGASAVAELLAVERPAILVPYPFATNDHQFYNAKILESRGLAQVIREKDLTPACLGSEIRAALSNTRPVWNQESVTTMDSEAGPARRIAARISSRIGVKLI